MSKWGVLKDQYKRSKKKAQDKVIVELTAQVNKIINHADTKKKSVTDWPKVHIFLKGKFPKVDVTTIPIYETSPAVMNKSDLAAAAGCFIAQLDIILVKNNVEMCAANDKSKFSKKMRELTISKIDVEDVVVHELVHFVSHQVRGVASAKFRWNEQGTGMKFRVAEEEFVYTVCVEYYKNKGMNEDEIVNSLFMPFCIDDVMNDKKQMDIFWNKIGVTLPAKEGYISRQYNSKITRMFGTHANVLAPAIIGEARNRAVNMIELYNEYGCKAVHNNIDPDADVGLRMKTIDLEDDDEW